MATATSLSSELLSLKEDMGWSWSEMASQVEGALNVKGPSGSTLFRYAKGQANPSGLVEQTVLKAIQKIRKKQLADAEASAEAAGAVETDDIEDEAHDMPTSKPKIRANGNVSERSITEVEKAGITEATRKHNAEEQDYAESESDEVLSSEEAVEAEGGLSLEMAALVEALPRIAWPEMIDEGSPFAAGLMLSAPVVEEVAEEANPVEYPALDGPTAHGAGIVINHEAVEDALDHTDKLNIEPFWPVDAIQWSEIDEDVAFAYGLSINHKVEDAIVIDDATEEAGPYWPLDSMNWAEFDGVESFAFGLSHNPAAEAQAHMHEEVAQSSEHVEEPDDISLIDPAYDLAEAGVFEHYELEALLDAQAAMDRDTEHYSIIITEIESEVNVSEQAVDAVDASSTEEEEPEHVEVAETEAVEESASEESADEIPVVDNIALLESLYENPARFSNLTPAQYFILGDTAIDETSMPTFAELGGRSAVEQSTEIERSGIENQAVDREISTEELADQAPEAWVDESSSDDVEIRLLSPFGEGSLYANGNAHIELTECPKAQEFSARSREIVYSPPDGA